MAITLVSIDVETTGKNHKKNQIIEFGAVIDDWEDPKPLLELPTFQSFIEHPQYVVEPYAAYLNSEILGKIAGAVDLADDEQISTPGECFAKFYQFLMANGFEPNPKELIYFVPAGKNFAAFDLLFLSEMEEWTKRFRPFRRSFDPCTLYYMPEDQYPPDTETCIKRAGVGPLCDLTHRAVPDAREILQLLRRKLLPGADS